MSESGDYSPGDWKGYDFDDARKVYDVHVSRSYNDAKSDNKRVADLVPTSIETQSPAPLIILCDVTGSMGTWPATMFSKLPYMDNECKEYLGEDMEISFAAVGDAVMNDSYPIQIRPFKKGRDLEAELKALVIEGGGGGDHDESYELSALFYARNAKMPNAAKPILIIIGDEGFHPTVLKKHAKLANVDAQEDLNSENIFEELKEKFSVYLIRKPYDSHLNSSIQERWSKILGPERIAILPSADRVVDVIFGILAKEKDKLDYFKKEIEERQEPDQIDTVYKSLETIHALPTDTTKSVMHTSLKGKLTKKLLP